MKFCVLSLALFTGGAEATLLTREHLHHREHRPLHREHPHHLRASAADDKLGNLVAVGSNSAASGAGLGKENCMCIGFDDVAGDTQVVIQHGGRDVVVNYPADLGASCETWDAGNHPFCKVDPSQGFCKDKWCYVDPKSCGLRTLPKMSTYQPQARFQTMPLYYSYATCDSVDHYAKLAPKVGEADCRCIGFDGSPGMTVADIDGKQVEYPAEIGGECKAWDSGHHPSCQGESPPDWCAKEWCFVDPCSCGASVPPKVSNYLGDATFQGKPVFWSYVTCGAVDTFSKEGDLEKSIEKRDALCKKEKDEPKKHDPVLGNAFCPCIGFDGIDGETMASTSHSGIDVVVSYPADLGGSCDSWDEASHPSCKGGEEPPAWCQSKWCYVDAKNCHLPTLPKESAYQPKATFQALPLYYSYSTCGNKDTWTKNAPKVGKPGCRCIGIDKMPGSIVTQIDGEKVEYPAEMGGQCKAWDTENHPACVGQKPGKAPKWCTKAWCYVDPCSCDADVPPKTASFLGEATFQGKTVFWSYATCGETDDYSTEQHQVESKKEIKRLCSAEVASAKEAPLGTAASARRRSRTQQAAHSGARGVTIELAFAVLMMFSFLK